MADDLRAFVARHTADVTLRDGAALRVRPILPSDKEGIAAGFRSLSDDSRRLRFFVPLAALSEDMLHRLTDVDHVDHAAWVAIAFEDGGARGAGVARYIRSAEQPDTAEAAVTVLDAYQGRGIGTVLLEVLTLAALERGITRFTGTVLRDNARMLTVLRSAGAHLNFGEPGVLAFTIDLPDRAVALERTPLYRVLRAAAEGQTQVDQEEPSER